MSLRPINLFVYYLATRSCPNGAEYFGLGQQTGYTIWRVSDGSVVLTRADGSEPDITIRQGQAAITPPGYRGLIGQRRRFTYGSFDIIPRRRRWRPQKPPMQILWPEVDSRAPVQPSWDMVTESPPGIVIPAHMIQTLDRMLERVCAHYWRSRQHRNMCNGIFQEWLASYLIEVQSGATPAAESDQNSGGAGCRCCWSGLQPAVEQWPTSHSYLVCRGRRLAERYRRVTGDSPGAVLDRARLSLALRLLERDKPKIQVIALKAGFKDSSAFGRRFRQVYGMSPTQWRRRNAARTTR